MKRFSNIARESADYVIEFIFALAYVLFITPHHVGAGSKAIRGNQWKRIIAIILTLITFAVACISTSSSFSRASIRSPAIIFKIAPDIGDTFLEFMFWYVICRRRNQIEHFFALMKLQTSEAWRVSQLNLFSSVSTVQKFNDKQFLKESEIKRKQKQPDAAVKIGVGVLCSVLVFLIVAFDALKLGARYTGPPPPHVNGTESSPLGVAFEDIRQAFFQEFRTAKSRKEMSALEIVVAVMYLIFQVYSMVVKAFAIILCFAGTLVVYQKSYDLMEYMDSEKDQLKVIQAFEAFREFVESINEITGPILFVIAIICAPTFYVANLSTIFISWHAEAPITWLTILLYCFTLMIAAEVTDHTDEFREWILECGEGPYEDQLFANFVDLTQNPLGLRGMECFTVTHGFLAQVFSAVVTFTIILLQFQSS